MRKGQIRFSILTLVILVLLPLLIGCSDKSPGNKAIDLASIEEPGRGEVTKPKLPVLKVAVASITSTKESIKYYDKLLNYLGAKLNKRVIIVQRKTYAEVNDLMRAGNVDLAFVCTYAYVTGREEFGMELLAAPKMANSATYQSYIIVPKDSSAKSFNDLREKTFAFTDPLSTTGRMYPLFLLRTMNESPDTFFKKYIYTYSHDNAIKAVADGLADGGAVDSLVYHYLAVTNPDYIKKTKVIGQSQAYGMPPVVVRPDLAPELKQELQDFFLGLAQDPVGREILAKLLMEKFVIPPDKEYDSIRSLARLVMAK